MQLLLLQHRFFRVNSAQRFVTKYFTCSASRPQCNQHLIFHIMFIRFIFQLPNKKKWQRCYFFHIFFLKSAHRLHLRSSLQRSVSRGAFKCVCIFVQCGHIGQSGTLNIILPFKPGVSNQIYFGYWCRVFTIYWGKYWLFSIS